MKFAFNLYTNVEHVQQSDNIEKNTKKKRKHLKKKQQKQFYEKKNLNVYTVVYWVQCSTLYCFISIST